MDPIPQLIPVVQQPKAVIRVATNSLRIFSTRPGPGWGTWPAVKADLDLLRLADPPGDESDSALKRARLRVL